MDGYYFGLLFGALIFTIIVYGAFPMIYALVSRNAVSSKNYTLSCWLVNGVIWLIFALTSGTNGVAYFLWTSTFCLIGRKILKKKGLLDGETTAHFAIQEDELAKCETDEDRIKYFKKLYQDMPENKLKKMLDSSDYLDITKQAIQQILDERAGIADYDDKPTYNDDKPTYNDDRNTYYDDKPTYNDEKPTYCGDKTTYYDKPTYYDDRNTYQDEKPTYCGNIPTYNDAKKIREEKRNKTFITEAEENNFDETAAVASFCSMCGNKLYKGNKFCSRCGAPIQLETNRYKQYY